LFFCFFWKERGSFQRIYVHTNSAKYCVILC
jgi:hypothetical protein